MTEPGLDTMRLEVLDELRADFERDLGRIDMDLALARIDVKRLEQKLKRVKEHLARIDQMIALKREHQKSDQE